MVSLAEAREQALANRKLARAGGDPLAEKRRSAGIPPFAEAAKRVIEQNRAGWRHPAVPRNWHRSFEIHVFPRIGRVPVSEVTSADVLEILRPLAHEGADGPDRSSPHPRRAGMGHRHGLENGQPVRPAPAGAWLPEPFGPAPEGPAPPRGRGGHPEGAGGEGGQGGGARLRVHGADGGAGRRGPRGGVERD
ncbi:phage integrase central domain-containing protein [Candidatus Palauibacter sp.]|uniref:phage integrase central domain-containing protein n=1 Tax=Candidatus Palauibacter sp. TaxID=3101350 RepID=UPI003B5A2436